MDLKQQLPTLDSLAHAYLIEGESRHAEMILAYLESDLGVPRSANPDLFVGEYELLGVDESRHVQERALQKPLHSERFCFVIVAHDFTREAQNALLKTFEDPAGHPVFFLVVPRADLVLPTLRSRCVVLSVADASAAPRTEEALQFLNASPAERLEQLAPLIKAKSASQADAFLTSLEQLLAEQVRDASARAALRDIYHARRFLTDRGASLKTLLEQVALTLPVIRA